MHFLNNGSIERNKVGTIIGGQGFIGRALKSVLESKGWSVWVPSKNDAQLFERDLGKVFYCAGLTADYLHRPFDTVTAHVNVLSEILYRAQWKHLVYLSSTRVYDGLSGVVDETNNLVLNPNNQRHLYDLSKLMGESLCLQTGRASVARLSCVYRDDSDEDGFLPRLIRSAIECQSKELIVDSSPFYTRDYVHLYDVLNALIAISCEEKSTIYNVASGQNVSNKDICSLLEKSCDLSLVFTQFHEPSPSPEIDITKIQTSLAWSPRALLPVIDGIIKEKRNQKDAKNKQ